MKARSIKGLHEFIVESQLSNIKNSRSIIDIGCGTGRFLSLISQVSDAELTGVDINPPDSLAFGRFHAVDLDSYDWPILTSEYDLVFCLEVVEHIENIGAFLGNLASLVSDEGLIIISTPNVLSVAARIKFLISERLAQFDSRSDPTHINPIFPFAFERMLKRKGLFLKSIYSFPHRNARSFSLSLKLISYVLSFFGLRGNYRGDNLIFVIGKDRTFNYDLHLKKVELTKHH